MIVNRWPNYFRDRYGREWPKSYICFDIETTGFDKAKDLLVEWGHCLVIDGKVEEKTSWYLNWIGVKGCPRHWIEERMSYAAYKMEAAGRKYSVSIKDVEQGMDPVEFFEFFGAFVRQARANNIPFVAHNGYLFDEPFISTIKQRLSLGRFSFGDDELFDTHLLEKASQAMSRPQMLPTQNDTLRSYFNRVRVTKASGVKSSLDEHCFHKFAFEKHGLTKENLHGAEADAFACHLIMEAYRSEMRDFAETPVIVDTPLDAKEEQRILDEVPSQPKPKSVSRSRQRRV